MSLIVSNFASEGGHWYLQDGSPFYTLIGANGVERIVEVPLNAEEKAAFDKSCEGVRVLIEDFKKLGV